MKNEKGSTLVENIVSVFILTIFSLMVFSAILALVNILQRAVEENERLYSVYTEIESDRFDIMNEANNTNQTIDGYTYNVKEDVTITFKVDGEDYKIDGSIIYDDEQKMGEFYRNEKTS